MVTAKPKKSDKPKNPVGRPRKKLGTRVTDVPLVSTLRPRAARSNADSAALQRMKLSFKRDYPTAIGKKGFDEYKTRALLDAMADPSRGPIGSRVLGPSMYKIEQKQAKLNAAIAANQPVIIQNGRLLLNKRAVRAALSTAAPAAAPVPVGPALTLIPGPPGFPPPPPVYMAGPAKPSSERTKSQTRRLAKLAKEQGIAYGLRNQRAQEDAELDRKGKKRKTTDDEPGQDTFALQTPYERELSNIRTALREDLAPADRFKLVSRMRGLNEQIRENTGIDVTPLDEPSTQRTPTPYQTTQATRIVRKFTAKQLTEAAARMKAAEGIKAIKAASPAVVQEVQRQIGSLMVEEPDLAPMTGFEDIVQAAAQERRRQLDEEERQMGYTPPLTENQLRAIELGNQVRAERDEPPPVFRPRSAQVAVIDVGREARENAARIAVERKARRQRQLESAQAKVDRAEELEALAALAAQADDSTRPTRSQRLSSRAAKENAANVLASSIKRMTAQNALNAAIRQREEMDRRAIADQAMLEEDALANEGDARRSSAIALQSAVKRALAQRQYNTQQEMADAATTLQAATRSALVRDAARMANEQQNAASTIQAAVRGAITRDAMNQAMDRQAEQDAAIRVIQRAVRDRVDGVAKQKRLLSKIQEMNTRIAPPRPPRAPGMSQPTLEYGDLIDDIDLTEEFGREDDAARQLQAALRRFADSRRFSTARETEAEYAAQNEIGVPGADIRPNNRTIPIPPPMPPRRSPPVLEAVLDAIDEVESGPLGNQNTPTRGFPRKGLSDRGLAEAAKRLRPFEGTQSRMTDFAPGVGDISDQTLQEAARLLRPLQSQPATNEQLNQLAERVSDESISRALESRRARMAPDDDDFDEDRPDGKGLGGRMGGGQYTLQAITFPDTDWKTSSSLRWLRSNGIKPIKKADHTGSLYRYRIVDPKGFTKYYTSELMSRGRKINMVYGKP